LICFFENGNSFSQDFYAISFRCFLKRKMMQVFKNIILRKLMLVLMLGMIAVSAQSQAITQTIKGKVIDSDSKMTLIGVNVLVKMEEGMIGATTDIDGFFKIKDVPLGRHNIEITYLGYEPANLNAILVTSGKELFLNIELTESTLDLETVVVTAKHEKTETINEMATVSARSFSVEETSRYAAAFYDPSRMAQNYAGVTISGGSSDLYNEIIVRGNSPRGVMWRLEGIEIPNPNHFGGMGNSGGAISMLSSSTLSNSDFYTGAFPSEFGNATSGVFDLNMRNGNNEKQEYAFMFGALGIEVAAEGPFSKNSKSSYLINYRYSTLSALEAVGLSPTGDVLPKYQDLSFKINVPTEKAGVFSLFGLGGKNSAIFEPKQDSLTWEVEDDKYGFEENQTVGTIGLSHKMILTDKSYLKTVAIASHEGYVSNEYWFDESRQYIKVLDEENTFNNNTFRITSSYTNKINAKNTLKTGFILSHMNFSFDAKYNDDSVLKTYLENEGNTQLLQTYVHWKYRFNQKLTLNSGLHYTYFFLNGNQSIEPRAALKYQYNPKESISAAIGIHSKPEHIAFYLVEETTGDQQRKTPNKNLEIVKSMHAVVAYDRKIGDNMRLKAEAYYQYLYDVPVEADSASNGSIVNVADIWDILGTGAANNNGTARNYGLDLTIERFFNTGYYFMFTGSLFDSKYTAQNGKNYNTRYNSNYQLNLLGGKEFKVGKTKKNIIGINGKVLFAGGNRQTPIDLEASIEAGEGIWRDDQFLEDQAPAYFRFDIGLSYKINKKRMTHTIGIDVQNVTNRLNVDVSVFNPNTNKIENYYQTGLFPNFNYRIEF
jgi:carboxypeptidase-like protein